MCISVISWLVECTDAHLQLAKGPVFFVLDRLYKSVPDHTCRRGSLQTCRESMVFGAGCDQQLCNLNSS
jgi:hypothetical protein